MRLLLTLLAAVAAWMLLTSYPKGSQMRMVGVVLLSFATSTLMGEVIPW